MSVQDLMRSVATLVALMGLIAACGDDGTGDGPADDGGVADTGDTAGDGGGDTGGGDSGDDAAADTGGDLTSDSGADAGTDTAPDAAADLSIDGGFPTTLIGPEGGTLVSNDGLLTLEIPPFALSEDVELAAVRLDEVDERFYDNVAYGLTPHGLTFALPVTMRIDYDSPPPAGMTFGLGRNHDELIEVWPTVRSNGGLVAVLIDGFDDGRAVEKQVSRGAVAASVQDGLIVCEPRDHCPRVELLDGQTVWIKVFDNNVSLQFEASNSLMPPALSDFQGLSITVEDGRRIHRLSGAAAIYWYRYNSPTNDYVSRIAYFGTDGAIPITRFEAEPVSPDEVQLSWAPIGFESAGDLIIDRYAPGVEGRVNVATLPHFSNHLIDDGLSPDVEYIYYIHHERIPCDPVELRCTGRESYARVTPGDACTISASAYGDPIPGGAPYVMKNSVLRLSVSEGCLPETGTPRFEWVRYIETTTDEGGPPILTRDFQQLTQQRDVGAAGSAHYRVEVCIGESECDPDDLVGADDFWIYTFDPELETRLVISPTSMPGAQQDFTIQVTDSSGAAIGTLEGDPVSMTELAFWSLQLPPSVPQLVHEVILEAPGVDTFDIAGGTLPHHPFGYDVRVRVFDEDGLLSIPQPVTGVFIQE